MKPSDIPGRGVMINPRFPPRKHRILSSLDVPDAEYTDASPKGSVDEPIRGLIGEINGLEGLVTTSSCSGRVSVFVEGWRNSASGVVGEGKEKGDDDGVVAGDVDDDANGAEDGLSSVPEPRTRAGPGGKGGGGTWLFVSHDPVQSAGSHADYTSLFGLSDVSPSPEGIPEPSANTRFIHFKFEPMILHILTASPAHAQHVLTAALTAGFRESGAINLSSSIKTADDAMPMVAVRSSGYALDCIIGYHCPESGSNVTVVSEKYLKMLVEVANQRFETNGERIARFRGALMGPGREAQDGDSVKRKEWEDADVRRRRKREEGLTRQKALKERSVQQGTAEEAERPAEDVNGFSDFEPCTDGAPQ